MTCQNKSDDRPDTQKRNFNREHNVTTFDYAIIFSNLDAVTARLLEYSLIAHYTFYIKRGKLPPKHKLPSFKNDDPWNPIAAESERVRRALKYIQDQIGKYGK